MMNFIRRYSGFVSVIVGLVVLVGLTKLTGWLLGPVKCQDGWASGSIGLRGACSHHGGVGGSRGGLFFFFMIAAGFSGWWVYEKLNPKPVYQKPNPILHQRCPQCGGAMHYDRQDETKARCNRYPVCDGEKPMDGIGIKPVAVDDSACPLCASAMRLRTARKGRRPEASFEFAQNIRGAGHQTL